MSPIVGRCRALQIPIPCPLMKVCKLGFTFAWVLLYIKPLFLLLLIRVFPYSCSRVSPFWWVQMLLTCNSVDESGFCTSPSTFLDLSLSEGQAAISETLPFTKGQNHSLLYFPQEKIIYCLPEPPWVSNFSFCHEEFSSSTYFLYVLLLDSRRIVILNSF